MKKKYCILLLLLLVVLLTACGSKPSNFTTTTPFSFTDQNGQPFGTDELTGTVWIADFIFTKCETVCLPMTSEMATLQQQFTEQDLQVEFVSFTVDPTIDSPDVLKEYIQQYTDDETNWHMLTGYSQLDIQAFARDKFQTIVLKPESSNQVLHGTNFYLIDQQGRIVKEYNYVNSSYAEELIRDIKKIQKK